MVNLINDGSLIGLWPLHEASGAPAWKNYSPTRASMPSGISFDFHVHLPDVNGVLGDDVAHSAWLGQEIIYNQESGVLIRGLKLQGRCNETNHFSYNRMLVMGNGNRTCRVETLGPAVAQSGFTVGMWVYPRSDGWLSAESDGGFNTASDSWYTGYGRIHALFGQGRNDIGWYLGVSGALAGATQFESEKEGGPHQLTAYTLIDVSSAAPLSLETPIESGRYTHLSLTYRYVDGTNNEVAFYKDGRLEASGITTQDIIFDSSNTIGPDASILSLGRGTDGTDGTDTHEFSSGWGHLVSGAYSFRRVLHEGEILDMHQRGGLQHDLGLRNNITDISLFDDHLISYISLKGPGLIDASKNHYNFLTERDFGQTGTNFTPSPGPFNTVGGLNFSANASEMIVAPSGATFALVDAPGGFTIAWYAAPYNAANLRDDNIQLSMGSVSTATTGPGTPGTVSTNSMCFDVTYFAEAGFGDRLTLEVFPLGDATDTLELRAEAEQLWLHTMMHHAVVYDAASQGIALYLDGALAASGTCAHNLQDQMRRVAGSGFPIMFCNGVTNQITDSATKGVHLNGFNNGIIGPMTLLSRPLRADELRFAAQSDIDTSILWRTRHDPRLMGYWPCDDASLDAVIIEDKARMMTGFPGPLSRSESLYKWNRVYGGTAFTQASNIFRDNGTPFIDLYNGENRVLPPELSDVGNLGITSGTWAVQGGSLSTNTIASNFAKSSAFNFIARYRPFAEQRDTFPQTIEEYIISFEVTPSGDIPALEATSQATSATQRWFNSRLHTHGDTGDSSGDGETSSFLTTINAPDGSGVTICFVSKDGVSSSAITPVISGTLPYGVPSQVLLHAKFDAPYNSTEFTLGTAPLEISLFINGQKVNISRYTAIGSRLWTNQAASNTTASWLLQFGGAISEDSATTTILTDSGLGEIYLREIFIMKGVFEKNEVAALAVSGIQNTAIAGYIAQASTTQVTISDSNLEGYWRFNGFDGNVGEMTQSPGGSGTTDISLKNNHLDAIAQRIYENGTSVDLAETMRVVSGPRLNADIAIQCSGFHNRSQSPATTSPNMAPPFAVSGAAFNTPHEGFSVGFLMSKRFPVATSNFDCILCYGTLSSSAPNGTVTDVTVDSNRGWAIGMDDTTGMKMVLSVGGNMYIDNAANAAQSGQIVVRAGTSNNATYDGRQWNTYEQGGFAVPSIDSWNHYCFVYDPIIDSGDTPGSSGLFMYINGELVDQVYIRPYIDDEPIINSFTLEPIRPQVPQTPEARMLTFRSHQAAQATTPGGAWDFRNNLLVDDDSVMTEVSYFSRALTQAEVRYAAFNGIDNVGGTPTSGIIGGFMYGLDSGSGTIGGYYQGLDSGSGIIGGYIPGGLLGSGIAGGYVSGVVFGDGTIGGFVQGLDIVSGILGGYVYGVHLGSGMIAGYIHGQEIGSGLFGGYIFATEPGSGIAGGYMHASDIGSGIVGGLILAGLQSNFEFDTGFTLEVLAAEDFDAQLEIAKTVSSDFDAKLIIFQDESPPLIDIVIPDVTVSGLAPPFNQYFIGKASGQQGKTITQTKWTFGDLSPVESIAESGAGCYPVQHYYATSGFYIAKFEAIDSDGIHGSATRIINAASGIDPVIISLSGVPRSGDAILTVDFTTVIDILPSTVSVSTQLLNFDDGQTTIAFDPTHAYTEPGTYKPIWCVRDSRGFFWCDSLEAGNDLL